MSDTSRFTLTRQDKRLIIGGVMLVLLALVIYLTLPSLIDIKAIQADLKGTFKEATGLDIEIQDAIEVSVFPSPHVKLHNLYVSNVPGANSSFLLSIHSMDVKLHPSTVFSSHPSIDKLAIDGVVLELERLKNGHVNWQELIINSPNATSASGVHSQVNAQIVEDIVNVPLVFEMLSKITDINLTNAEIHFTDPQTGIVSNYSDINAKLDNDSFRKKAAVEVSASFGDTPLKIVAELDDLNQSYKLKTSQAKIHLESGVTHLDYEGDINFDDSLGFKGKTVFESTDITGWIKILNGQENSGKSASATVPLPLKLSSTVNTEGKKIFFPDITVEGGILKGKIQATYKMPFSWDIKGDLDSMDLNTIISSGIFATAGVDKKNGKAAEAQPNIVVLAKKSLWSYLTFGVDIKVANADYNNSHIKNAHFEFDMSEGDMTISQISGTLPGDSKILFTGLGKEGYQGFMLDGQLDASGESFSDVVSFFKPGGNVEMPVDFKRYRIKSNIVFSAKELRFTELSARIENMAYVGGIIVTLGDEIKILNRMRIGGINADHLIAYWGINKFFDKLTTENLATTTSVATEDVIVSWLKNISYTLDSKLSVEQYTLGGKLRDKLLVHVMAEKNKLDLSEIEMGYNESQIGGKISLNVKDTLPFMDIDLAADTLDISQYVGDFDWLHDPVDPTKPPSKVKNWSHRGVNFHWLDFMNAAFRFRLGQFKTAASEINAFDIRGSIDNRTLNIPLLSGVTQGSQFAGKLFIKGGKIPSATYSGDLTGFEVSRLAAEMPFLEGMNGKYNIHYRLSTSGIDVYTWLYNLEGNVTVNAKEVTIDGFNLPGIVNAVGYVRTVADILDAVKRAFPGGNTVFNTLDGEWTIGNGVIKIPNIKFRNDIAEGQFTGQVDALNWKMSGHINFALTYLDRLNPPKMTINYTGSLDTVEKELDTRLLEQYVANKTSEKLLNQSEP